MNARWLDITPAQYHALRDDALTQSLAVELLQRSPRHARRKQGARAEPAQPHSEEQAEKRRRQEWGTLVHAILLGGKDDRLEVAIGSDGEPFADWRKKDAQRLRADTYAAGKIPVLQRQVDAARKTADRVREALDEHGIVLESRWSERAIEWQQDGVRCRGMFDNVPIPQAIVYDLKTTGDAHPDKFRRTAETYGYDVQAAAYVRALEQLEPRLAGRVRFRWILVEVGTGEVVVCEATPGMLHLGGLKWERAVRTWGRCLELGHWPGYGRGQIVPIEPSEWAYAAEERARHDDNDLAAMVAPRRADTPPEPPGDEDYDGTDDDQTDF